MEMLIAVASVFAVAAFAWLLKKSLPFRVCPICAGVSLTWAWMLAGVLVGQLPASRFELPAAILMGGSVVGIAYQAEKRLAAGRSPLLWKLLFIPAGFGFAYALITQAWSALAAATPVLAVIIAFFFIPRRSEKNNNHDKNVEELEKKMKQCC